jgi:pimeloyl-ACP methyl ester carboxylesterase
MRKFRCFIPRSPARLLVLAHGYPWPDGSKPDDELSAYAQAAVDRWRGIADLHDAIVAAPVFGGTRFPGYRELTGEQDRPDGYVNSLVDRLGCEYIRDFDGTFSLHGHSAGAQFAARYLIAHPGRLDHVILSAPSTYPPPDPSVPWPNGMGNGGAFTPKPEHWLTATTEVNVVVLVGTADTEPRPAAPGQQGSSRIERATFWVESMRRLSQGARAESTTRLIRADGYDHDEVALAAPAKEILDRCWTSSTFTRLAGGR